ncbi:MAG: NYN domain-containing protein [bacterium]|nr:NYN domain-containing protein [bacterium]
MPRNPVIEAQLARPTRRIMVFVDGENLVFRYQDMLSQGYVPRDDLLFHEKDVAVWSPSFTLLAKHHEILRVTYYTYVVGDETHVTSVRQRLRELSFNKHMASLLPNSVTPCVFKKDTKSRTGKGVDIKLCVDVLGHVYRGNTDAILLMSGDGDYEPLIEEVQRAGVQVFLSAFSSGLNSKLRQVVDSLYELDGTTWKERPG